MDNECQLISDTIKQQLEPQQSPLQQNQSHKQQQPPTQQHNHHQQETFIQHDIDNESTSSPKVTVSLPKHVASRLRELVQKRDIALLRLGIISVQFEDDQIIPLILNQNNTNVSGNNNNTNNGGSSCSSTKISSTTITTTTNTTTITGRTTTPNLTQSNKLQDQQLKQTFIPAEPAMEVNIENCNVDDCIPSLNTTLTALNGLANSPDGPILEGDELDDLDSNIDNASSSASLLNHIKYVYFDNITNYFDEESNNTATKYN